MLKNDLKTKLASKIELNGIFSLSQELKREKEDVEKLSGEKIQTLARLNEEKEAYIKQIENTKKLINEQYDIGLKNISARGTNKKVSDEINELGRKVNISHEVLAQLIEKKTGQKWRFVAGKTVPIFNTDNDIGGDNESWLYAFREDNEYFNTINGIILMNYCKICFKEGSGCVRLRVSTSMSEENANKNYDRLLHLNWLKPYLQEKYIKNVTLLNNDWDVDISIIRSYNNKEFANLIFEVLDEYVENLVKQQESE